MLREHLAKSASRMTNVQAKIDPCKMSCIDKRSRIIVYIRLVTEVLEQMKTIYPHCLLKWKIIQLWPLWILSQFFFFQKHLGEICLSGCEAVVICLIFWQMYSGLNPLEERFCHFRSDVSSFSSRRIGLLLQVSWSNWVLAFIILVSMVRSKEKLHKCTNKNMRIKNHPQHSMQLLPFYFHCTCQPSPKKTRKQSWFGQANCTCKSSKYAMLSPATVGTSN